ncbi:MAG: polysaccharide biosynthesis/export family protein [Verrucomicrobiota bacterium]
MGVFSRLGALLVAVVMLSGCETFESSPSAPPSAANVSAANVFADSGGMDILRANDLVQVYFSGNPSAPKDFNERIKEDGTISPPMITTPEDGSVKAEGKTVGELQKILQERYNKYFRNLTVTVLTESRYFYVDGEVRSPSRQAYSGAITVTKAIAAAGGFTDFAKRSQVHLIRANGQKFTISYDKALRRAELDLSVHPGDQIVVPRRRI